MISSEESIIKINKARNIIKELEDNNLIFYNSFNKYNILNTNFYICRDSYFHIEIYHLEKMKVLKSNVKQKNIFKVFSIYKYNTIIYDGSKKLLFKTISLEEFYKEISYNIFIKMIYFQNSLEELLGK